jgi:hypothetical protein
MLAKTIIIAMQAIIRRYVEEFGFGVTKSITSFYKIYLTQLIPFKIEGVCGGEHERPPHIVYLFWRAILLKTV